MHAAELIGGYGALGRFIALSYLAVISGGSV